MLKPLRTVLWASLAAALISVAYAQTNPPPPEQNLQSRLEPMINQIIAANKIPGLAIGVVKNGKLLYSKGFGVAKLGSAKPITTRTLFHMASVTKTFVATSVMQLVEQGKIDLDKPLTTYLPYFKMKDERYRAITIRQMLSHTSGIPDVSTYNWDKPEYDDRALERFVRSVADMQTVWAPGEKFGYSNTAFEVLGDVIAKVSGQSFEEYVKQHILVPLGMRDSTLMVREANPELLASPHVKRQDQVVVSTVFPYNRAHAPSSTLDSSIEDMSRWAIANLNRGELDGKRILKASTYDVLWNPVASTGRTGRMKVAVSWFVDDAGGHRIVMHSGGDVGFNSMLILAPDDSLAVIAMTNYSPRGACYACDVSDAALKIMLGLEPTDAKARPAPEQFTPVKATLEEVLDKYVQALGGKAALEKITSRVSKGTFEVSGAAIAGTAELYQKAPNKRLLTLHLTGEQVYKNGFDGETAWEQDPDEGVSEVKGAELATARRDSDFYQAIRLRELYPRIALKGGLRLGDRETIVLEAPRNDNPKRWYFDAENGLLVRTDERRTDGTVTSWQESADYKSVDGVKVPFTIRVLQDALITIKLTDVRQNVPVEDSIFSKPKL